MADEPKFGQLRVIRAGVQVGIDRERAVLGLMIERVPGQAPEIVVLSPDAAIVLADILRGGALELKQR